MLFESRVVRVASSLPLDFAGDRLCFDSSFLLSWWVCVCVMLLVCQFVLWKWPHKVCLLNGLLLNTLLPAPAHICFAFSTAQGELNNWSAARLNSIWSVHVCCVLCVVSGVSCVR